MQRGSMLPLVAGLLALTVAALIAISSLTSLTLERHRLVALAEATALRAAESFDPAEARRTGESVRVFLTNAGVRAASIDSLRQQPHRHRDLRLIRADTPDGLRARVVLQSTWMSPMWSEFLPASLTVRAEALSRPIIE